MVKSILSFCILFTILLVSCSVETVEDPPIDEYVKIWKELIQEQNNFDQSFFDLHIKRNKTNLNDWNNGFSLHICYDYQIDWAIAKACDSFIIKIKPNNDFYPAINLPRNQFLSKEEIKKAIKASAFNSKITTINPFTELKYISFDEAMKDLIEYADFEDLVFLELELKKDTGNLIIKARGVYSEEENTCVIATVDLITGEKVTFDLPCSI